MCIRVCVYVCLCVRGGYVYMSVFMSICVHFHVVSVCICVQLYTYVCVCCVHVVSEGS